MKKLLKIILSVLVFIALSSCERDISDLNKDPKHLSVLPSGTLLSMGTYQEFYYMNTGSVSYNNYRFFTQQWSEVTYVDESNYDLTTRYQPRNHYTRMMVYTLNNFNQGMKNLEKEINTPAEKNNKWATLELSMIYTWENIVDTYGDVPYFDALKANDGQFAPKYDDAKLIYQDLFKRLDAAIAKIDVSAKGYTSEDLVYAGNMSKWKKMANTLRLRLAMNLADVDPSTSKQQAEMAFSGGLMASSADNYQLTMDGVTYFNPLYDDVISSGRFDFIPSDRVVNLMNSKNDPRRAVWFVPVGSTGQYVGGPFGATSSPALPSTTVSVFTGFHTSKTGPVALMNFVEQEFLLAEAAARGYNVGGSAEAYYNAGVNASMAENGIASSAAAYLAANPYSAANWKKSIGEEAYISLFNKAFAVWNFTRRLDQPSTLINPAGSKVTSLPVRMPYSDQEYTLNNANVKAAAAKIGGDLATTKLFWDKY